MKYDKNKRYYLPIEGLSKEQMDMMLPLFRKHGTPDVQFDFFAPGNYFGIVSANGKDVKAYSGINYYFPNDIVSFGNFMEVFFDMISKPEIVIGGHVVEFDKGKQTIKVGCTSVDINTIKEILKELES